MTSTPEKINSGPMTDTPNLSLLLVQSGCFTTTLALALVLLMSRFHLQSFSRSYETSRWMLFTALLLFAIHYLLQMLFGFRAQSEDMGALVNILFYLPIALMLASATLRISTGHHYLRQFMTVGLCGIIINLVLFVVGLCIYHSLDMPWVLHAMKIVYVLMIAFFIFGPGGELQRMSRKIEDETADDNSKYHLYMRSGTTLLYAMGGVGAMSIFSTSMVVGVAAFFLLAIIFYVVSFLSLGFNIQAVSCVVDELDDSVSTDEAVPSDAMTSTSAASATSPQSITERTADGTPTPAAPSPRLSPEQVEQVSQAIAAWRAKQGYCTSNLTSITMAQRLGIPKRLLTQYLAECEGNTFRVWLSNLRIEEAKRMLIDTGYSVEAIAEACGFSSRSWMMEKFKASTGMTPAEWRDSKMK